MVCAVETGMFLCERGTCGQPMVGVKGEAGKVLDPPERVPPE